MSPAAWMVALEEALARDTGTENLATALVVLASVAGAGVVVDEAERRAATRRATLLVAAGGDPAHGLDLNGRAVSALADDLREIDRQIAPEIAWRAYACSLLAEALDA